MPLRAEKCAGFVQPQAGVAIAPPGVAGRGRALVAQVGDGGLQGVHQFRQRRRCRRFVPVLVQPAACRPESAVRALRLGGVMMSGEAAVREIDLTADIPARVLEQPQNVACQRARLRAGQSGHKRSKSSQSTA